MKYRPLSPRTSVFLCAIAGSALALNCGDGNSESASTGGAGNVGGAIAGGIGGSAADSGGMTGSGASGGTAGGLGGSSSGGADANSGGSSSGGADASSGGSSSGGADANSGGSSSGGSNSGGSAAGGGNQLVERRECDGSTFPTVKPTQIMEGGTPVYVTSPPNDASRIFVVDLGGKLSIIEGDNVVEAGSFSVGSNFIGEQGFHSIAFHPKYDGVSEKRLYLHFSAPSGNTRVVETTLDGDVLDTSNFKDILTQDQPDVNHNGGQLQFGLDGYLYISLGDGGNSCDEKHGKDSTFATGSGEMDDYRAMDLSVPLGSILRIDVDNLETFPAGNIAAEGSNDGRILHWGLRNTWRFSFDRGTGDLWLADVGQNKFEELNVLPAGDNGAPGPSTNFGWPGREGFQDSDVSGCSGPDADVPAMEPILDYGRGDGVSITGGYVYRGAKIPAMQGRYVFADYDTNNIWSVTWNGTESCEHNEIMDQFDPDGVLRGITSFGEDADGELYVATVKGASGVYRIDPE